MTKNPSVENKPTRTSYNAVRVLAMLMVLAVHVSNECEQFMEPYNTTWYLNNALTCFFMIANPLFFMLSGKFNLKYKFESTNDYFKFYYKKIVSIVIPFVLFSVVSYIVKTPAADFSVKTLIKGLMNNEIEGVYWFVYTLISILALSPFFTKMVENMSIIDKKMFFAALILFNAGITLFQFVGNNRFLSFSTFGVINWHIFYFIGYLLEDVINTERMRRTFMLFGAFGFCVHFLLARFCENPPVNIYDPSPWMVFEAIGVYLFVIRIRFKENRLTKIIDQLAGISFVFYLMHMIVVRSVAGLFPLNVSATITWVSSVIIFIISFVIIAGLSFVVTKFLINPMNKFLRGKYEN